MNSTAIVGLAGIIATGGSAIWLRALDNRRQKRQLTHDRRLRDIDALRLVLSDAADIVRRAAWAMAEPVEVARTRRHLRVARSIEEARAIVREATLVFGEIVILAGRESAVARTFAATLDVMLSLAQETATAADSHRGNRATLDAMQRAIDEHEPRFNDARAAYLDAAQRAVGVDLPTD